MLFYNIPGTAHDNNDQKLAPREDKFVEETIEVSTKEIKEEINESNNNNNVDIFNNCKSVLGKCIADGDTNCLCAQINDVNNFYDSMLPNENFEPNKLIKVKLCNDILDKPGSANDNMCEGCECSKNDRDISIELTKDGAIKIKDTFDIDLYFTGNKENGDLSTYGCKAALGKCIVSGSGEECLCAKMALDDQMIEQEIDEITPQPNVTM